MGSVELDDLKTTIRSLLITEAKRNVSINELRKMYIEMEGCHIPYQKYNYRTLLEFLKTIPDVVKPLEPWNENSPLKVVLKDDSSAHIYNMIVNQKQNSKSGSKHRPMPRQKFPSYRSRPRITLRKPISYEFKEDLQKLLQEHPQGLPMQQFEKATEKLLERHYLNYTINEVINNMEHILQYSDSKIRLKSNRPPTFQMQQIKTVIENSQSETFKEGGSYSDDISDDEHAVVNEQDDFDDYYVDNRRTEMNGNGYTNTDCNGYNNMNGNTVTNKFGNSFHNTNVNDDFDNDNDSSRRSSISVKDDGELIGKGFIRQLRQILNSQKCVDLEDFSQIYKDMFHCEIPLAENGFTDVMDLVTRLDHVFYTKQYTVGGRTFLYDATRENESTGKELKISISNALICDIYQLLKTRKQIPTNKLINEYKALFNKDIDYKKYGIKNDDEFIQHLDAECDGISIKEVGNRLVMSLANTTQESFFVQDRRPALPAELTYDIFPNGTCQANFELPQNIDFEALHSGDTVDVVLGEIYSPARFYIQLEEKTDELDKMMTELHDYYQLNEDKYKVYSQTVTRNLYCACIYDGAQTWHRVRVTNVQKKTAHVIYIDYGTNEQVPFTKLRYLVKRFAVHPAFCVRAKLADISPKADNDGVYPASVNRVFYEFSSAGGALVAKILNNDVNFWSVHLAIRTQNGLIMIHERLLEKGLVDSSKTTVDVPQLPTDRLCESAQEQVRDFDEVSSVSSNIKTTPSTPTTPTPTTPTRRSTGLTSHAQSQHENVSTTRRPPPGLPPPPLSIAPPGLMTFTSSTYAAPGVHMYPDMMVQRIPPSIPPPPPAYQPTINVVCSPFNPNPLPMIPPPMSSVAPPGMLPSSPMDHSMHYNHMYPQPPRSNYGYGVPPQPPVATHHQQNYGGYATSSPAHNVRNMAYVTIAPSPVNLNSKSDDCVCSIHSYSSCGKGDTESTFSVAERNREKMSVIDKVDRYMDRCLVDDNNSSTSSNETRDYEGRNSLSMNNPASSAALIHNEVRRTQKETRVDRIREYVKKINGGVGRSNR